MLDNLRSLARPIALMCLASLLVSCAALVPRLRDDYMGKSILQPNKVPKAIEYDEKGNAVVEDQGWSFPRIFPYVFRTD